MADGAGTVICTGRFIEGLNFADAVANWMVDRSDEIAGFGAHCGRGEPPALPASGNYDDIKQAVLDRGKDPAKALTFIKRHAEGAIEIAGTVTPELAWSMNLQGIWPKD